MKRTPAGSRVTAWALVGQLGFTIAASIVLGLLLGLWVDGLLGTRPLFTLLLSLVGISAASYAGYRAVSVAFAQLDEELDAARQAREQRTAGTEEPRDPDQTDETSQGA